RRARSGWSWMTEPTGRRSGSAAAIPVWTFTPDAVVVPLQYAVAVNRSLAPGVGTASASWGSACRAAYRDSRGVTSYREANAKAATAVAKIFRPVERDSSMLRLRRQLGDLHY